MPRQPPDFDAADLADSILGADAPAPDAQVSAPAAPRRENREGKHLGWTLLLLLVAAVSIAISLAVQLDHGATPRVTPPCDGLYADCCAEWDENWGPCIDECDDGPDRVDDDDGPGLFDAEENFADHRRPARC